MSTYTSTPSSYGAKPRPYSASTATSNRSNLYAPSALSSRNYRYGSKPSNPVTVHNGGGATNDPNTSTSAPHAGHYS